MYDPNVSVAALDVIHVAILRETDATPALEATGDSNPHLTANLSNINEE